LFVALQGRKMGRETEIPGTEVSAQDKSALPGPPNRVNPERAAVSTAVPSSPAPSLPDEEQRYRTLIEQLPAILYIAEYGAEGRCYFVSSKIRELLGFEPEDWLGDTRFWIAHVHPEDRPKALGEEEEAQKNARNFRSEYRLQHRNGSYRWFRDEGVPLITRPGGPPLLHGVLYDIHDSKLMEAAVRGSEERYRVVAQRLSLALESSALSLWDLNVATGEVFLDEQWSAMLGGPKAPTRTNVQELFAITHPDDRERTLREAMRTLRGETERYSTDHRVRNARGEWIWVHSTGKVIDRNADGRAVRAIGTNQNISDRREAQQKLQELQDRLHHTLNSTPVVVFSLDTNGIFLLSEGQGMQALGRSSGQFVGQSIYELCKGYPEILENFRRALSGAEFTVVTQVSAQSGVLTFEMAWMPLRNAEGAIIGVAGVATNITERKRAETALRESEERLRQALSAAEMGVWEWDAATNRTAWDASMCSLAGFAPGEYDGRMESLVARMHPEDRDKFLKAADHCARTGESYQLDFRIVRPDGRTVWIADQGRPEFDADGKLLRFRGVARDVTRERELQDQLRGAQRMEAIGKLAGGVAHDFNNLLTVIRGNSETLLAASAGNVVSRQNAEAVLKAADRAAAITRQLLAFSRKQVLQPKVIELGGAVSETANLLRRLLGPAVKLELQLPAHSLHVRADGSQLEQVVLNLVVNARDAMPQGGTVAVSVDRAKAGSSSLRRFPQMRDTDYALLTVTDTGTGMDAATRARIFEPFFTTKELGKGTGLGLATVYGIVKQSEGWIWVDSAPGMGTTFEVFLPEVPAPQEAEPIPAPRTASLRGTETLVLVDDEEDILELTAGYLGSMGYQVISALSGEDALEKIGGHAGKIDALITDALMPGMPGTQLAKKVRELRPEIKILYMSGYAEDSGILSSLRRDGEDFLQKPFGLTELGLRIRELLGRHA
jgi:two-component system cell cycle sensor histidine kinase/response regulator CckA